MHKNRFLRRTLIADATISGTSSLLLILGAAPLSRLLEVPSSLLLYAGISLIPFTALLLYVITREHVPTATVWTIIGLNAAWVVGSILLLFIDSIDPSRIGVAFIVIQAVAVAAFAEMQYVGLRRLETR